MSRKSKSAAEGKEELESVTPPAEGTSTETVAEVSSTDTTDQQTSNQGAGTSTDSKTSDSGGEETQTETKDDPVTFGKIDQLSTSQPVVELPDPHGTAEMNQPLSDEIQDKPSVPADAAEPVKIDSKREITEHQVNEANEQLRIHVLDEPGAGGANHLYLVDGFTPQEGLPSNFTSDGGSTLIAFQNGPIIEVGVNGLTQEVLLAIVADRLASFQAGPYACPENAEALIHVRYAQKVLQERTKARLARGVEGTHAV